MIAEHCWHMRSLSVTGPKKSREMRRCCHCGQEQGRVLKAVAEAGHGPHVKDVWRQVEVDADEVPACKAAQPVSGEVA